MKSQAVIRKACIHNAIKTKGTEWVERDDLDGHKKRKHVVYEWNPEIKQELIEYHEQQNKMPCGHPSNIKNNGDSYGCRYCPDDEQPEYSKETVRRAME